MNLIPKILDAINTAVSTVAAIVSGSSRASTTLKRDNVVCGKHENVLKRSVSLELIFDGIVHCGLERWRLDRLIVILEESLLLSMLAGIGFSLACYSLGTIWLLFLLPALFLRQPTLAQAYLFILGFYLGLNWEEIPSLNHFFDLGLLISAVSYLAHSALLSCIWLPLYFSKKQEALFTVGTGLFVIVLLLPPLGYFVWVQPIAAAGSLYPGMKWLGLVLTIMLMVATSVMFNSRCHRRFWRSCVTLLLLVAIAANGIHYGNRFAPTNSLSHKFIIAQSKSLSRFGLEQKNQPSPKTTQALKFTTTKSFI